MNPNVINFMAKHGRGLICLAITKEQSDKLGLSLMERRNESRYDTAFTRQLKPLMALQLEFQHQIDQ